MDTSFEEIRSWFGARNPARASFDKHLKGCYVELYRAALRFTRKPDDAEDLLQDAVLRAYRSFDHFQEGTNFKAWMWRILTNLYITQYGNRQKHPDDVSLDVIDTDLWRDDNQVVQTPEAEILERVLDHEIEMALQSLPEPIRIVVIMTELQDMPYQEVADVVGIPVGTVRSRLFRGRAMMRDNLEIYAAERGWIRTA
ncbi:MAG: sigma-70 family RNA polymerase sigma factor [Armatimonadota bacterium]